MANLNIPFLLLQENSCKFSIDEQASGVVEQFNSAEEDATTNLMVLSDCNSGCMALCQHESMITFPKGRESQLSVSPNKFIISVRPKVLCVPSIFKNFSQLEGSKKVILQDYCLVKSPAAKILNTSDLLLVTIHIESLDDAAMRLWSIDDGRCIMRSPQALLKNRSPQKMFKLNEEQLPGFVLCLCHDNEILIINSFTMTLVQTIECDFQGLAACHILNSQSQIQLSMIDSTAKIQIWKCQIQPKQEQIDSDAHLSGVKKSQAGSRSKQLRQCSTLMLGDQCNHKGKSNSSTSDKIIFNKDFCVQSQGVEKNHQVNRGRGKHREIIQFQNLSQNKFIIVYQDRVELVDGDQKHIGEDLGHTKVLLQYEKYTLDENDQHNFLKNNRHIKQTKIVEKWFEFAQFINKNGEIDNLRLVCVDSAHNLMVYDILNEELKLRLQLNLFNNCHLFDLSSQQLQNTNKSLLESQDVLMRERLDKLSSKFKGCKRTYKLSVKDQILYTFVPSKERDGATMLSWSLQYLLKTYESQHKIPMYLNNINVLGQSLSGNNEPNREPNCILNLNQFITKNYFSRHQHSFFYSDEKITDQTFYVSSDFPSMVIGTNYGRIFIVQLFQDIERRAYPIIVIDAHNGSSINCIYIAYSSARRQKQQNNTAFFDQQRERSSSQQLAQSISLDSGGHLIACSDDGTISITNMNSGEVVPKLANFSLTRNEREIKRIDSYMKTREMNNRQGRRQSVDLSFSTGHYFNLVRAQPYKVFNCLASGRLSRIVEVQAIQKNQLDRQRYQTATESGKSNAQGNDNSLASVNANHFDNAPTSASLSADRAREVQIKSESPRSTGTSSSRTNVNQYSHHLQAMKDLYQQDSAAAKQQSPLLDDLMPFRASYACIDSQSFAVYILSMQNANCDLLKIHGLDSQPIGVYEDVLQNIVHVITEKNLNVYTYNQISKQLLRKSNYAFAQASLQMNQTVAMLIEQQYFKQAAMMSDSNTKYDQYSFEQQFLDGRNSGSKNNGGIGQSLHASGHHKVLDYLSMSLSLPLYYHPHHVLSQKFTKSVKDLLPDREEFKACLSQIKSRDYEAKVVKDSLRKLITNDFIWNDRYKSDFSQEHYHAQGAVTPLLTGCAPEFEDDLELENETFRQQMIVINTKDMINVFKSRMKVLTESLGKMRRGSRSGSMNEKEGGDQEENSQPNSSMQQAQPNISADYLQNSKWPTRLLSLVHPFTLDGNLDENLELFFGLSIPFVDFRIGVQGADEAFSFIIARNDRDKEEKIGDDINMSQIQLEESIKLLRLSKQRKVENVALDDAESKLIFVNSEYWKASSYMSTIMSSFFLGTLVSIVEYAQPDITTLMQDWLNVVQYITSSSTQGDQKSQVSLIEHSNLKPLSLKEFQAKPLSVSALSQLMLRKDHSISSCARDVIMKPLLSSGASIDHIKDEINEWQDLIMDTYLKLKEDASMRQAYEGESSHSQNNSLRPPSKTQTSEFQPRANSTGRKSQMFKSGQSSLAEKTDKSKNGAETARQRQTVADQPAGMSQPLEEQKQQAQIQPIASADKSINHFFGELEIRGLVNLSYFALYSQDGPEQYKIETDVQNRLCKCTVILTREIMTKFTSNCKEHQNLLTILMQLLQTQMRAEVPTFETKVIKEDVIKILLLIYDFYKKQLRDERFLTRVVAENFHLIHPKNSELYLKLTAAKTLLEIGTYFTEDFLLLIHEQGTTLKDGPEYQRNVLDVLRYFINGSRDGLEPYLIQIVQTLLKCLDPNDEHLRRNSTQLISIILSTMVKSFPMIAFHHETQRLAVGTPGGPIAIYDVRTSQKWKILEGHTKNVICVEFDAKGNLLASYSAADTTLRLWKVGNTGFFSTIMGGTGKSIKELQLEPIRQSVAKDANFSNKKIQKSNQSESRKNGAKSSEMQGRCKIKFVDGEKAVHLTREDGSVKELRLIK